MKSAQELASETWTSPEEQKRLAVALRRLAGGVKAVVERKKTTGLTDKEVKVLLDAIAVLNTLANTHTDVQKLTQQKRDARAGTEAAVRAAMRSNFGTLTSIPDQIGFISAVSSYLLREKKVVTLNDLTYYFTDCFESLSYSLASKVSPPRWPLQIPPPLAGSNSPRQDRPIVV